jgi:zinc/manganese transport system ATP-binding protein
MTKQRLDTSPTVIQLRDASLKLGGRQLWQHLNLSLRSGEFLAVLGPNGSGKTSLIRILLGLGSLAGGSVTINGTAPRRGNSHIGYVPQQKGFDPDLPITGRDLVHFGLDGYRYGLSLHSRKSSPEVDRVIREVGATSYADAPIGLLSGGEQQRLRIAQALLGNPSVLLCDEPLLSLDITNQQAVSVLIDEQRRKYQTSIVFVTHDINPILPLVDKVLYLVGRHWAVGKPDEVLTSERLSELYKTPIDVIRVRGKVIVVGGGDQALVGSGAHHGEHHKRSAS